MNLGLSRDQDVRLETTTKAKLLFIVLFIFWSQQLEYNNYFYKQKFNLTQRRIYLNANSKASRNVNNVS